MVPTLVDSFRRWFEYEKDSHRAVLKSLDTVPESGRQSEAYHKALGLVAHIVAARRVWLHRIDPAFERPAGIFPKDVRRDELPAQLAAMERDWTGYLARATDSELERVITYQSVSDPGWYRSVIVDILTQVHGHSLYHRGQIASLVRIAGGEPAVTDFIFWSREAIAPPEPGSR
jgi:uncharacterized damage-inducible protein DinB